MGAATEQESHGTHAPLAPGNDLICIKAQPGMNTAQKTSASIWRGGRGRGSLPAGRMLEASSVLVQQGRGGIHTPSFTFPCRHWKMRIFLPRGGYNLTPSSLNVIAGSPPPQELCHAMQSCTWTLPLCQMPATVPLRAIGAARGEKCLLGAAPLDPTAPSSTSAP